MSSIFQDCFVDGCNNYTVLGEADRAQESLLVSSPRCDRYDLASAGWYRFQGAAGDQMPDKCVPMNRCGTHAPGWLSGAHPTVAEGVVTRKVCYHWRYNCCLWSNNITVRNCGAFFVYKLQKTPQCYLRYCGNASAVDGCNNYTVLSEADRAQRHLVINASNERCDDYDLVSGWYRFQGAAGYRMADRCVPLYHCGTAAPGWLSGAHPTVAEGVVTRRVCYHWSNSCCYLHNNIRIKNCTAYFVYELARRYVCNLRYCGNGGTVYTCPALTVPSNGIKLGCPENATMYNGTVCQFSCNDGYIGSGSQARRCQLNGTWSGQDFTCQIINCTSLTHMVDPGGPLRMSSCENHFGANCNFFCAIGYRLNGSSTVTCVAPGNQHPGVWNSTIPTCEGILCEPLQLAPYLKMNTSCSRLPEDSCEFGCERGYDLIGSSIRRCNSDGKWTGTQPRCDAVKCSALTPPTSGEILGCNTTEMLYNTVCRFSCNEGSEANGSMVRRCTENGTWSGTELFCIGICGAVEAQETRLKKNTFTTDALESNIK